MSSRVPTVSGRNIGQRCGCVNGGVNSTRSRCGGGRVLGNVAGLGTPQQATFSTSLWGRHASATINHPLRGVRRRDGRLRVVLVKAQGPDDSDEGQGQGRTESMETLFAKELQKRSLSSRDEVEVNDFGLFPRRLLLSSSPVSFDV